jgi:hypothetical protein
MRRSLARVTLAVVLAGSVAQSARANIVAGNRLLEDCQRQSRKCLGYVMGLLTRWSLSRRTAG